MIPVPPKFEHLTMRPIHVIPVLTPVFQPPEPNKGFLCPCLISTRSYRAIPQPFLRTLARHIARTSPSTLTQNLLLTQDSQDLYQPNEPLPKTLSARSPPTHHTCKNQYPKDLRRPHHPCQNAASPKHPRPQKPQNPASTSTCSSMATTTYTLQATLIGYCM